MLMSIDAVGITYVAQCMVQQGHLPMVETSAQGRRVGQQTFGFALLARLSVHVFM
jgi:hypothetical protein